MGIASGIGSQAGLAAESTYGTYVAPTRFLQADKVSLKKVKNTVQSAGFAAGRLMPLASGRVVTTHAAAGTINSEILNRGMGLLIQALMGTSVTPVQQGSTTAYLQTHTLADTSGKSLTIQAGVPDRSGTVHPYSYLGCKVTAADFSWDLAKDAAATFTIDARDVDETKTLAVASYTAGTRPFVGTDATIKVGTYGSEVSVPGVTKADIKIDRGHKLDSYYFGAGGLKAEPVINAWPKIGGSITAEFVNKADWADRFAADTPFSLVFEAVGVQIGTSGINDTFRITLPTCYLDGDTPMADTLDVISGQFPFTCLLDDAADYPKIEIISADTTL